MTMQKSPPGRAEAATNGAQKPKPAKTTYEKSGVKAPVTPIPWEPLEEAKTIDDVVRNFDQVIDWAIRAESTVGYFAILYRRSTVAVHEALKQGKFINPQRMQKFDVVFAQRYFDALNAYFMPHVYPGLTLPWEVAFVGHDDGKTTIIQQMMTGLNAHICFDLGLAAVEVAANDLDAMKHDFDYINELVALQVPDMLRNLIEISPDVVWLRRALPAETEVIKDVLTRFRDGSCAMVVGYSPSTSRCPRTRGKRRSSTIKPGQRRSAPGTWNHRTGHRFISSSGSSRGANIQTSAGTCGSSKGSGTNPGSRQSAASLSSRK